MPIQHGSPEQGTYRFVLINGRWATIQAQLLSGYDETTQSRAIEWNGKTVHGAFVRSSAFASRLQKPQMGAWEDITKEWFHRLAKDREGPAAELLAAMRKSGEPMGKGHMVDVTGMTKDEWTDAIADLLKAGLVEPVRSSRGRLYALVAAA